MTYTVRRAQPEDAAELARLRWEFRVEEQSRQTRHEFSQECQAWLKAAMTSGRWVVAVASSGSGLLCGCMYLQCVDEVPTPGEIERGWGYVTNSYVSSDRRGRGIGRDLLSLLIDAARARKLELLIVWPSEEAVSLYERAGFRPLSEVDDRPSDYSPLELKL